MTRLKEVHPYGFLRIASALSPRPQRLSPRRWLSSIKWLALALERGVFLRRISNWLEVLIYYTFPIDQRALRICFRDGYTLHVPRSYIFQMIAETQLLNVYGFPLSLNGSTVIDVGASVGDFVLFAQRAPHAEVYAFEPDPQWFKWLSLNVNSNALERVVVYNSPFSEAAMRSIFREKGKTVVDFMKIDCEGCEYELLNWSPNIFQKVNALAMETHIIPDHSPSELIGLLERQGFHVLQRANRGRGPYLFASRRTVLSNPPERSNACKFPVSDSLKLN